MYEEKINAYFDAPERRAELVEAISRLVRIRSVREEPLPGMPFGPGPAAALAEYTNKLLPESYISLIAEILLFYHHRGEGIFISL